MTDRDSGVVCLIEWAECLNTGSSVLLDTVRLGIHLCFTVLCVASPLLDLLQLTFSNDSSPKRRNRLNLGESERSVSVQSALRLDLASYRLWGSGREGRDLLRTRRQAGPSACLLWSGAIDALRYLTETNRLVLVLAAPGVGSFASLRSGRRRRVHLPALLCSRKRSWDWGNNSDTESCPCASLADLEVKLGTVRACTVCDGPERQAKSIQAWAWVKSIASGWKRRRKSTPALRCTPPIRSIIHSNPHPPSPFSSIPRPQSHGPSAISVPPEQKNQGGKAVHPILLNVRVHRLRLARHQAFFARNLLSSFSVPTRPTLLSVLSTPLPRCLCLSVCECASSPSQCSQHRKADCRFFLTTLFSTISLL